MDLRNVLLLRNCASPMKLLNSKSKCGDHEEHSRRCIDVVYFGTDICVAGHPQYRSYSACMLPPRRKTPLRHDGNDGRACKGRYAVNSRFVFDVSVPECNERALGA